ncbi:alpha/beta hydrolase [Rhodococcus sp. 05-340-1]|uniref:alpha/beta fold hydrolase n=1 Tax=unclassified Rhodococcus (in: high G+C Gram-positive bacteria) TaxID=192944 RepID=UPI000B9AB88E|nr:MULTISPECIES: alpha/beta hydrolase [unclassified Rhodococcus (in: high G+C Gram-positive bacteria)]OZD68875.1 alpha/beta hydrolase [Rhodococcus sp. 05-340-2]OZD69348.1 alpha/beta hydrolase [Rhodococcus sp. 05-340-1]
MTTVDTSQDIGKFADLPSGRVHYVESGSGHPVVLLHGSGPGATGSTNFSPNTDALAEHFRVIAPDMPGWGHSDTPGEAGYDHPNTLIELLDELGIDSAALVGNSMGGVTSIATAINHPERVSHLITMGPPTVTGPLTFSPKGPSEGIRVLVQCYFDPTPENLKRLVQVMCFDQSMATDELAHTRSDAALSRPDHLDSFRNRYLEAFERVVGSLSGRASSIVAPTLLIHGRDDRVAPFESSLQLATQIANSRMLLINRCGHWAQIEHAAEFNRAVVDFITNN